MDSRPPVQRGRPRFEALKGRDALLCRALAGAAKIADCVCYLALLLIKESDNPEDDY